MKIKIENQNNENINNENQNKEDVNNEKLNEQNNGNNKIINIIKQKKIIIKMMKIINSIKH